MNYSAADYRRDYEAYARALVAKVPQDPDRGAGDHLRQAGVAVSRRGPRPRGSELPVGPPVRRVDLLSPVIAVLPDDRAAAQRERVDRVRRARSRTPPGSPTAGRQALRLTEVNSISCGGNPGVANSFATALWAPDALFELIRNGANSINWQIRPKTVNAPFHPTHVRYPGDARAVRTGGVRRHDRVRERRSSNSTLSESGGLHLKAWVVRVGSSLRVLLLNKGPQAARVTMQLGTGGNGAGQASAGAAGRRELRGDVRRADDRHRRTLAGKAGTDHGHRQHGNLRR